jgi:putative aminopeptidase FrvX
VCVCDRIVASEDRSKEEKMEKYVEYIGEQLKKLTAIPSPTGYTKEVSGYVSDVLAEMGYEPEHSRKGNICVTLGGEGEPLLLAAHLDTLGAMVRAIKANGRLQPTTLGGHKWDTCDGENCTVHTRDGRVYTGVVLNKEPSAHVASEPVEKEEKNMEILLDENVETAEEVQALGIQTGDIIAMDPRTVITQSGYIKSRFLDDKLSASILLGLAKYVKEEKPQLKRKVSLLFTVFEEVGHGGSAIPEDTVEMISVDMGCVGDDLGCTERMVSICAKDSGGPYNYDVVTALLETAKAEKLDYAIDIYPYYSSDVEASLKSGHDILHGLVGPGVYASHNYERSHVDGVRNTFCLLKAYI